MSSAGLRVTWVVVEAEEDVAVYERFMQPDSTVVKTSESETGRKGYANVELIVREIKQEVSVAHIMGIRDADYSRYKEGYTVPDNIFLTDRRDLEMMLLETESVKQTLRVWLPMYDDAFGRCIPICRHFGYLRIFNEVADMTVTFHNHLRTTKFWDYQQQAVRVTWEEDSTARFVSLSGGKCTAADVKAFVTAHKLEEENLYDVCRGHDLLSLLSLVLIKKEYSVISIMHKMIEAYSLNDFKASQLYADIKEWQNAEGANVLVA